MIGKALDSNNDIIVENGSFKLVENGEQVAQNVKTRLQLYLGEWFLDITEGTPWFQQIFIRPTNLTNIESILKTRITNTPEVLRLNSFSMDYEGGSSRNLSVSFSAETIYGTLDVNEVIING
jgi:hypothetical protein